MKLIVITSDNKNWAVFENARKFSSIIAQRVLYLHENYVIMNVINNQIEW